MNQLLARRMNAIEPLLKLLELAAAAAAETARQTYRERQRRPRDGRYAALQAGPDTPLWNALAAECEKELGRYGAKANLGRLLGLPRQRIHQLLVAKTACADAERTLQLMGWLIARRRGLTPG